MGIELAVPLYIIPHLYFSQFIFYQFYLFLHLGKFLMEERVLHLKKKKWSKTKKKLKTSFKTTGNLTPKEQTLAQLGEMICLRIQKDAQQS